MRTGRGGGAGRRARSAVGALGVLVVAASLAACQQPPGLDVKVETPRGITAPLTIKDPVVTESSGLAVSAAHPGILYTHNDRGSDPAIYAIDQDGNTVAVLTLPEDTAGDWEDIEVTPDGMIWVGDIGDNAEDRRFVRVIAVQEPDELESQSVAAEVYRLRFPDGPHNAEGLMVDPVGEVVYVVTKRRVRGGIYGVDIADLSTQSTVRLRRVAEAPPWVTAASFADDGDHYAVRNGSTAFIFESFEDDEPVTLRLPPSPQGESLVYLRERGLLLVGSEGVDSRVELIQLPTAVAE